MQLGVFRESLVYSHLVNYEITGAPTVGFQGQQGLMMQKKTSEHM
jgi:hypothetical protein